MTQYKILSSDSAIELGHIVERYMKTGWLPQGGVAYDTNRREFIQAMVKQ